MKLGDAGPGGARRPSSTGGTATVPHGPTTTTRKAGPAARTARDDRRDDDAARAVGGGASKLPVAASTRRPSMARGRAVTTHEKARAEAPKSYPARAPVPDHAVAWAVPLPGYAPKDFTDPSVTKNVGVWADVDDPRAAVAARGGTFQSALGKVHVDDATGRPLNPQGRTGIAGRGLLGRWGANQAGDPIVTRLEPGTGALQVVLIKRADSGQWALPGGMVDEGEQIGKTIARELAEETSGVLDFGDAKIVYQGYVDDRRNTDNAWMETTAAHKHLDPEAAAALTLQGGDDATEARWVSLDDARDLYASHGAYVRAAVAELYDAEKASMPAATRAQVRRYLAATA